MSVRVRFAPSPTGYLHIGGLRTALFCYLFARAKGGTFVLRIEDTDRARFVADAEEDITESLAWIGLTVDEGPHLDESYRQSARTQLYQEHAARLLAAGHAYYAFDTPEALQAMRKRGAKYDRATRLEMANSLTMTPVTVTQRRAEQVPFVVRMRIPDRGLVAFTDRVKGAVSFSMDNLDDQVLLKSDGHPTYHLANVVDDHYMGITHVIRGEEWLSSVPKHLLLYDALGWAPPEMAHLPLILSPAGGKLSKRSATRHGIPINVRDYRAAGYEPEALVNFLALLGWHPETDQELFTPAALEETFSLRRVTGSPAQFDLDKLRWFNQQHLSLMGRDSVAIRSVGLVRKAFGDVDSRYLKRVVETIGDRLALRKELTGRFAYFFQDPASYDARGTRKRWKRNSAHLVAAYASRLEVLPSFSAGQLEASLRDLAQEESVGAGAVIHPVRLAVSGTTAGPGLFDLLETLGRARCVRRLRRAVRRLG